MAAATDTDVSGVWREPPAHDGLEVPYPGDSSEIVVAFGRAARIVSRDHSEADGSVDETDFATITKPVCENY